MLQQTNRCLDHIVGGNDTGARRFTFGELLIVIAIIILASFLLPTLARARDAAQTVVCMNSLEQIYLATPSHADDSGGPMEEYSQELWDGSDPWVQHFNLEQVCRAPQDGRIARETKPLIMLSDIKNTGDDRKTVGGSSKIATRVDGERLL